jgi:DNA recombination protein RmuC
MEVLIAGLIAAFAGIVLGYWLRLISTKAEAAQHLQRIAQLEAEVGTLRNEVSNAQAESNARAGFEALASERLGALAERTRALETSNQRLLDKDNQIRLLTGEKGEFAVGLEAERRLREQSELTHKEQLGTLQETADRWRAEAEASAGLLGQLATESTLAAERLKIADAYARDIAALRDQLLVKTETERSQSAIISQLQTELQNEREGGQEKLKLLTDARTELTHQFESLAGKILDEKSIKFTEQNKTNLDQLLSPLKVQIQDFRGKVEEAQKDSLAGRVELRGKLDLLEKLNQQLTAEAHNLTTALRGSSKAQGDWGEFILKDLLEKAGLREGEQFSFQQSFSAAADEDGGKSKGARTDVIVYLPGGRHLIVDSKVSLNAYTDYVNAGSDEARRAAMKLHLASVRSHLDGLSKRRYHKLAGLDTPDFVVMFIPVEPAFLLAMQEGGDLWREAYERDVLLVGPTTLLFVIRIVDNLWQQERQARNVDEVMERGAKLYDKFVGFVDDLTGVGQAIKDADSSYSEAFRKLSSGDGNLIRQVEMLRELGAKPKRSLKKSKVPATAFDEPGGLFLAAESDDA